MTGAHWAKRKQKLDKARAIGPLSHLLLAPWVLPLVQLQGVLHGKGEVALAANIRQRDAGHLGATRSAQNAGQLAWWVGGGAGPGAGEAGRE